MLEVREIFKSFGDRPLLRGGTLRMKSGIWLGLSGPAGCGKSTLLNIITQNRIPDSGDILCDGKSVLADRCFWRKKLGYVPQKDDLCNALTVEQQLALWRCAVRSAEPDMETLLDLAEIEKLQICQLSADQRKRLSVAMAFQNSPEYLFMDEALSCLEPVYQERILQWITEKCRLGMSVLWCSRNEEGLDRLCSERYVLQNGILAQVK